MGVLINEIGNRYSQLVVVGRAENDKWDKLRWLCRCDCGNERVTYGDRLRKGGIKRCGHLYANQAKEEKVGTRYGNLTVIGYAGRSKHKQLEWKCMCDCGNEVVVLGGSLRSGDVKSCGCLHKLPRGQSSFNLIYRSVEYAAKKRGLEWKLSKKQVKEIGGRDCAYCGASPSHISKRKYSNGEYVSNGIDRVDNNKGYLIDNVVACCLVCNMTKSTKSIPVFLAWIKKLIIHNKWSYKDIDNIKFKSKEL